RSGRHDSTDGTQKHEADSGARDGLHGEERSQQLKPRRRQQQRWHFSVTHHLWRRWAETATTRLPATSLVDDGSTNSRGGTTRMAPWCCSLGTVTRDTPFPSMVLRWRDSGGEVQLAGAVFPSTSVGVSYDEGDGRWDSDAGLGIGSVA
ncbi:hypothetical protein S83_043758, partial [Arachis hypogaea]